MNADFVRIAHRRTVWAKVQQLLLDTFLNGDQPAKEQLVCEEVPFSQKEVSQEALLEVLEQLEQKQQDERFQMSQFELRRRDARPAKQPNQEASVQERRKKKKRPKQSPPADAEQGGAREAEPTGSPGGEAG